MCSAYSLYHRGPKVVVSAMKSHYSFILLYMALTSLIQWLSKISFVINGYCDSVHGWMLLYTNDWLSNQQLFSIIFLSCDITKTSKL